MGVGGVVGSAIFNILVVPALSGLASDAELDARTARHSDRRRAASRCGRVARGGVRDPGVSGGCHHRRGRHQPPRHVGDVRTARAENSATGLGNVLGSNTFDLLVVIPIGVLIVGAVTVDFATAVPMFGVLTLATVLLFGFLRTDLSLTSAETDALLGAYLLFVASIVAESVGATHALKAT